MEDFENAVKLNNSAVACLLLGERHEAFVLLKRAFATMSHAGENLYTIARSTKEGDSAVSCDFDFDSACSAMPFVPIAVELSSNGSSQDTFTFQKYFLFNSSLMFEKECENSYRAVILFNLALLYQTAQDSLMKHEHTILTLLDSCLGLLRADGLEDFYIAVAALNNKAQIFHKRRDARIKPLLENLRASLRDSLTAQMIFDESDMNGLLLNITCQGTMACADTA
jgi:hypothetical protein